MRGVRFKDEDEEEDNHLTTTEDKTPKKKKRVSWIACPEEKEKEKGEVCVSGSESSDGEWLDPGVLALIDVGVVNCCHRYQIEWTPIECLPLNPPTSCVPFDHEVSVTPISPSSPSPSSSPPSSSFTIQFLVPPTPGKFSFPLGLKYEGGKGGRGKGGGREEGEGEDKGAVSLPVAELKGRAIRKRSGTPFLKKGVILVESPLESDSDDSSDEEGVKTNEFHLGEEDGIDAEEFEG